MNNNDHTNVRNYHQHFMRPHYATAESGFISGAKSESLPAEEIERRKKKEIFYLWSAERNIRLTDPERV